MLHGKALGLCVLGVMILAVSNEDLIVGNARIAQILGLSGALVSKAGQ